MANRSGPRRIFCVRSFARRARAGLVRALLIGLGLAVPVASQALLFDRQGKPLPDSKSSSPEVNWKPISGAAGPLAAVGMLVRPGDVPLCTATLINPASTAKGAKVDASAPAYVLTAAHCVLDTRGADQVVVNAPTDLSFVLKPELRVAVTRIAYASTRATDLAILELGEKYAKLVALGMSGVRPSARLPVEGEPVLMAGIPVDNMPESRRIVHVASCSVRGLFDFTGRIEGFDVGQVVLPRAIHHDCSAIGGVSGAPLLSVGDSQIVGLVSWTERYSRRAQALADDFTRDYESFNGASKVADLAACFTETGLFQPSRRECRLEGPCEEDPTELSSCAVKACKAGFAHGCFEAGADILLNENGQLEQGLPFFKSGCALGDARSCEFLAQGYRDGAFFRFAKGSPAAMYTRACEFGSPEACLSLAHHYSISPEPRITTQAVRYLDKACRMSNAEGCEQLASRLTGSGANQLRTRAMLLAKACVGERLSACRSLGEMYQSGIASAPAPASARKLFDWACANGDSASCEQSKTLSTTK